MKKYASSDALPPPPPNSGQFVTIPCDVIYYDVRIGSNEENPKILSGYYADCNNEALEAKTFDGLLEKIRDNLELHSDKIADHGCLMMPFFTKDQLKRLETLIDEHNSSVIRVIKQAN